MNVIYLRAGSYNELRDGLIQAGVLQELENGTVMPTAGAQLAVLGEIPAKPVTNDEGELVAGEPIAGFHANLVVGAGFAGDVAVLEPFVIAAPSNPYMP